MSDTTKKPNMIGASIIGGLANLASTAIGSITNRNAQERTSRENRELAEYSYNKDLEMWNRTNEYNLPSSQMARLKDAGLNPNLIYGSGGATTQAATMPKYNAPQMNYNYKPMLDPLAMLGAFQDYQLRGAQINNAKAQTENIQADTALKVTSEFDKRWRYKGWSEGIGYENAIKRAIMEAKRRENRIGDSIEPYQADMFRTTLNAKTQEARLKRQTADFYDLGAWTRMLQGFGLKFPSFRK